MKTPPRADLDHGAPAARLDEISRAVRARRLVPLLKGEGLTRSTVEELLRPESLWALKAILSDHLFPSPDAPPAETGAAPDPTAGKGGPTMIRATATTPEPEAVTVWPPRLKILSGTGEG